ncbi:MAG: sigma factor-like helix-turn-helix DNA-binding protein [bacterium]
MSSHNPREDDAFPEREVLATTAVFRDAVSLGLDGLFDRPDVVHALTRAVRLLPVACRLAVILVDVDGHSYSQVAHILEIPIGMLRTYLYRGRRMAEDTVINHAQAFGIESRHHALGGTVDTDDPDGVRSVGTACTEATSALWVCLDGQASHERESAIRSHLSHCTRCTHQFAFHAAFLGALKRLRTHRVAMSPARAGRLQRSRAQAP